MNVELLTRVKEAILREPKQFYMGSWFANDSSYYIHYEIPNCGTTACIGGWAVVLGKGFHNPREADEAIGSRIGREPETQLQLTPEEGNRLFFSEHWPEQFRIAFDTAETPEQRAQIAANRIEHFIKTEGRE